MSKFKDYTGQRFGKLTAIRFVRRESGRTIWEFYCDCGKKHITVLHYTIKSCGCGRKRVSPKECIVGEKFGRLKVKSFYRFNNQGNSFWKCECDCGNETIVKKSSLKSGETKSCGCLHREIIKTFVGENNPNFKGGRRIDKYGYVVVRSKKKAVFEHRLVMERYLGRKLLINENIHHKNGVRDDNRLENLELWVKNQPCGQRVQDLVKHAREILELYEKDFG